MNLTEALKIIESGQVFSLKYVPFDKKKKTGGGHRFRDQLMITVPKSHWNKSTASGTLKSANHKANATRNFYRCINGESTSAIITVHIFLMLEVNGQKIML